MRWIWLAARGEDARDGSATSRPARRADDEMLQHFGGATGALGAASRRRGARSHFHRALLGLLCACVGVGCDEASPSSGDPGEDLLRPRSEPIEFVGLTVTRALTDEADFLEVVGPLFGEAARAGTHHRRYALDRGLLLSSAEDPRTREQAVVSLEMEPTDGTDARTVLRVPVSYDYGALFIDTVRVALATTQRETAGDPDGMHPWKLEYHVVSANGGYLMIRVEYRVGAAELAVQTENPRTSLRSGLVNTAAFEGTPHEMIGGTVNFVLSRDEFDFFSSRAYGISAGRDQNFDDFQLLPHDWLRITVTPLVDDGMVDVAFDVVLLDGRRVPFARAPASYVAGEQFRQNVFRMLDNMRAQETEEAGSSRPFTVPFHYDDPTGGGVVRVIATGEAGRFGIAYAVDSPLHALRDVEFVPYVGNPVPEDIPPPPENRCEDHGSVMADAGRFTLAFDASRTVRESDMLADPLRGTVRGSVYRAEDVTISGPRDGAEALASFRFDDVYITEGISPETYLVDAELPAGDYQILGFMDIDGNGEATGDPDVGDPVTLPIGGYAMQCADQPVTVEFALLLPDGV